MSILSKKFPNHFGIDAKSNDLNRPPQFAYNLRNSQNRKTSGVEKRKGYQAHGDSLGGFGLFTYNRVNKVTASDEAEVLSANTGINRLLKSKLTVAYSGAEATAFITVHYDPVTDQYRCKIVDGLVQVLDEPLGKGFD